MTDHSPDGDSVSGVLLVYFGSNKEVPTLGTVCSEKFNEENHGSESICNILGYSSGEFLGGNGKYVEMNLYSIAVHIYPAVYVAIAISRGSICTVCQRQLYLLYSVIDHVYNNIIIVLTLKLKHFFEPTELSYMFFHDEIFRLSETQTSYPTLLTELDCSPDNQGVKPNNLLRCSFKRFDQAKMCLPGVVHLKCCMFIYVLHMYTNVAYRMHACMHVCNDF